MITDRSGEGGLAINLRHVVLGFLNERPMHGYELKRTLSPALPPAQMINDGVLYPLLKGMERDGLISKRVERAGKAPARNVYRPTKSGRDEFARWLGSSEAEGDEVEYDFMVGHPFLAKCLFFEQLTDEQVRAKLRGQLEASAAKLAQFVAIREGMAARGVDRYRLSVIDLGITQQRAKLEWLERTLGVARRRRARTSRPGTKKAGKAA